jgi:probable HAF family extracellular repeat protein
MGINALLPVRLVAVAALVLCVGAVGPVQAVGAGPKASGVGPVGVRPQKLGGLPGAIWSGAVAMNAAGQVVGTSSFDPEGAAQRPFLWQRGRIRDLGRFADSSAVAIDINEAGQVLVRSGWHVPSERARAWVWDRGRVAEVGPLAGGVEPVEINDRGQVLLMTLAADGQRRAAVWRAGTLTVLRPLPGGGGPSASDLNERGDVVGLASGADGTLQAVLWRRGRTRPVRLAGSAGSEPSINERGDVALTLSSRPDRPDIAALWSRGRVSARANGWSTAAAVNDRGIVVGVWKADFESFGRAMVLRGGRQTLLPMPTGFQVSGAHAVNSRGQIHGFVASVDFSRQLSIVWQDGRLIELMPGAAGHRAYDRPRIDDHGRVVGAVGWTDAQGVDRSWAALWTVPAPRTS